MRFKPRNTLPSGLEQSEFSEPYDPPLIRKALEPERLTAGCGAVVFSDAGPADCGTPMEERGG